MCCCTVFQCCCGCTSHKTGVIIWALIDALVNIAYVVYPIVALKAPYGPHLWGVLILIADLLLALGAEKGNTCLIVLWQIIMMIQIILLFILWIVVPFLIYVIMT